VISDDVTFGESFQSAIATTWQQHHDSLCLKPMESYIPDPTADIEHTGDVTDFIPSPMVKEGNINNGTMQDAHHEPNHNDDDDNLPPLMDQADNDSVDNPEYEEDDEDDAELALECPPPEPEPDTPSIVDSSTGP
jgi:hypothetical protein